MSLKKKIILLGIIGLVVSISLNVFMWKRNATLEKDYHRQLNNVTALTTKSETDTIRDSIPVTVQGVISENVRELQRQQVIDKQLIKDLKIRLKDIKNVGTVSMANTDTVYMAKDDSTKFHYSDVWANISIEFPTARCIYNTRDSIETYIYAVYKHRFLWFRWGKAGYNIKIVNFNPHSRIAYSRFINIEK
jgi:hypothetical protein